MGGQIMDASVVEAPRQRNSQEEKEVIKSGDVPKSWEDNPGRLRQKDCSARWIRTWAVTDVAAYDGARLPELLHEGNCASPV